MGWNSLTENIQLRKSLHIPCLLSFPASASNCSSLNTNHSGTEWVLSKLHYVQHLFLACNFFPSHTDCLPLSSWYIRIDSFPRLKTHQCNIVGSGALNNRKRIFVAPASASLHLLQICLSESASGPLRGETPHHFSCHSTGLGRLYASNSTGGQLAGVNRHPSWCCRLLLLYYKIIYRN